MPQTTFQIAGAFQGFLNGYVDPTTGAPITPQQRLDALRVAHFIEAIDQGVSKPPAPASES
jgi:hypothetical protein